MSGTAQFARMGRVLMSTHTKSKSRPLLASNFRPSVFVDKTVVMSVTLSARMCGVQRRIIPRHLAHPR